MTLFIGRHFPRWAGGIGQVAGVSTAHAIVPWALALIGERHGWIAGKPGTWNLAGLIPVAAGLGIFIWSIREHFTAAPAGWTMEKTAHYPTPAYLLTGGPYRYSCNPIYLAELVIWLGWMVFYGSLAVLGVFAAAAVLLGPVIVPREERGLEARFGDLYRQYRRTTPRWVGRPRPLASGIGK